MSKEACEYLGYQQRLAVFKYAEVWGNVAKACRAFAMPRASYYKWKKAYDAEGAAGLVRKRPIARNHPRAIAKETVGKVLVVRFSTALWDTFAPAFTPLLSPILSPFSNICCEAIRSG